MADFAVRVLPVRNVRNHPDADRLSIMDVLGFVTISAKLEDGSHRYQDGDLVVYVGEGSVVPEYLLKPGFWKEDPEGGPGKGMLAGSRGDRVKAMRLRGVFSQGIMFPVQYAEGHDRPFVTNERGTNIEVSEGGDVAEHLCITKYEPPVPVGMAGEVVAIFGHTANYDFESIQTVPDLFEDGEIVVATEKLHGTNCQIGYVPNLDNDELFFDGNLYVGSKGMSAKGLVMKNNAANDGNVYVRTLRALIDQGFGDKIRDLSVCMGGAVIRVFGEVYGKGVQDLAYGTTTPQFAVFDIQIDGQYVTYKSRLELAEQLGLPLVPVLYEGPFDREALVVHRDGKDSISGTCVREGIVIVARDGGRHPNHGRKIGKWISPDYLLRKGNVTEFN
jgi:RNA ligase (TIGR02306 family)